MGDMEKNAQHNAVRTVEVISVAFVAIQTEGVSVVVMLDGKEISVIKVFNSIRKKKYINSLFIYTFGKLIPHTSYSAP
jgi:hypothetical protein